MRHKRFEDICEILTKEIQDYWAGLKSAEHKRRLGSKMAVDLRRSVAKLVRDTVAISFSRARKSHASIHKTPNHYTKGRYAFNVGYRIHIERAYEGMCQLGYLRQTKLGISDGTVGRFLTRYVATEKLINMFGTDAEVLPALFPCDFASETIIVQTSERIQHKGKKPSVQKTQLDYTETAETQRMRSNLTKINRILSDHWIDLELDRSEQDELLRQMHHDTKRFEDGHGGGLDFTKRSLYRVFNNLEFTRGGRFYGGWWQTIPKKYRSRILIDGKRTVELDYGALHPTILYTQRGLAVPDDPYAGILQCMSNDKETQEEFRGVVKRAFLSMLNAKKPMSRAPTGLNLRKYGITWKNLSAAILERHKPIADAFYSDCGAELQRIDSDLAEGVMLHFASYQGTRPPVLPVHDSFIMHHGYQEELRDVMDALFNKRFKTTNGVKIKVKRVQQRLADNDLSISLSFEEILRYSDRAYERRLGIYYSNKN